MKCFVLTGLLLLAPLTALARDIPCGAVEPDVIQIDGLLNDWKDVQGVVTDDPAHLVRGRQGREWDGPDDLSFVAKCNYDERRLYLAIDVHDDRLVRTRRVDSREDRVEIAIGRARLSIWPGDLHADIPRVVRWNGSRRPPPAGIEVAEAMQPRGWSVEVAIPWKLVPGWSRGVAQVRGTIAIADADWKAPPKLDAVMSTGDGQGGARGAFVLGEGSELYDAFLSAVGARKSDVVYDRMFDMGGDPGLERVVRVGKTVGVIGKEYLYFTLPVADLRDLKDFQVVDLAGDGRHEVVARYLERGAGGSREVLAVWKIVGPGFRRLFAIELAKQQGASRIENRCTLVARGHAHDVLVEAGSVSGFSAANYHEATADDMVPILLPWEGKKRVRFRFRGDEYFPVEGK